MVVSAGFVDFTITWKADVFADAPQHSSAAEFGTKGINFRARKGKEKSELEKVAAGLVCGIS